MNVLSRIDFVCIKGTKDEPVQNDAPIYLKYYYLYDYRGKMQSSTHNPDAMFSARVFESLSELLIQEVRHVVCWTYANVFFFGFIYFSVRFGRSIL